MKIVGVTACPTGIAHTYMAAEAIEEAAKAKGYEVKVETRGSVGVENELTAEDIAGADAVILAVDTTVPMDRFVGKKLITVGVAEALKGSEELIDKALKAAPYKASAGAGLADQVADLKSKRSSERKGIYKHLMNGVSFMIPFVVAGGILIALGFLFGGIYVYEDQYLNTLGGHLFWLGKGAFGLMLPILGGYIAYSIADRPGLAVGAVGAVVASTIGAGFLGAMIAGFLGGYVVLGIKKVIKLPRNLQGIMPVLVIPVLGVTIVGLLLYYVVGGPAAALNTAMSNFLTGMQGASAAGLGLVLGLMMAFDMGGPVNKAAYAFATGTLVAGQGSMIMAAVMAAGMTPPLGIALATVLFKNKFTKEEHEAGKAAWVLGISFITEGAIPFAAEDPLRVIPSLMIGSGITGALSMIFKSTLTVPHGGIFVLFAVGNLALYAVAIAVGMVVTALLIGSLKKKVADRKSVV